MGDEKMDDGVGLGSCIRLRTKSLRQLTTVSYAEDEKPGPACKGESRRKRPVVKTNEKKQKEEGEFYDARATVYKDANFKAADLEEAGKAIKKCYLEVEKTYDKWVEDELKNKFAPLLDKPARQCILDSDPSAVNRPPLIVKPFEHQIRIENSTVFRYVPHEESQTVLCSILEGGDKLPRMQYWSHIEDNVITEDNARLSHVPYLNETQDDEKVCEALNQLFEDGIHGWSDNWRYINDSMLYDVLEKTKKEYKGSDDVLYFAFYQLFPNKYSARQLPEVYEDLSERWLDDKKADGPPRPVYLADETTDAHSIATLGCLQCITYDCIHHGLNPEIPDNIRSGRWAMTDLVLPGDPNVKVKEPCSKECYKNIPRKEVLQKLAMTEEDVESNGKAKVCFGLDETLRMQSFEGSILRILYKRCNPKVRENFCDFARGHQTKFTEEQTCKQAYYSLLDGAKRPSGERLHFDREPPKIDASTMHRNFRTLTWANSLKGKMKNSHRLDPCKHNGPCGKDNAECICIKNGVCTKFCACDDTCKMKFPGCRCGPGQCRTRSCQCFFAKWECDPVTCKSCNCDVVGKKGLTCRNNSISSGLQKKMKIIPSIVSGWGAYIMEPAEKGDLISEYTGEVITSAEVERRGHIYDKLKCSYIFGLNDDQCIDANRMGNMIRFANHADAQDATCYSKILIVNGQHHIGIFAKRNLRIGEELLFDYSYNRQHKEAFVSKGRFGETRKKKKERKNVKKEETPSDDENDVKKEDVKGKKEPKKEMKKETLRRSGAGPAKKRGTGSRKRKL